MFSRKLPPAVNQCFDGIEGVQTLIPEMLVVPGVFANRERHLLAAKRKQLLAFRRSEIAHLVENVIGGQQHLRLQESDATVVEQRRGIHHRLAALRLGWSDQTANHGDAASLGCNVFSAFAIVLNERGALHQIARRIATDGELGKKD